MIELFEEVDKNDLPSGKLVTKAEAHQNRLIHRCAVIYVFDQRGNLYLQKHKKSGNRLDHSAGGHVKAGESYQDGARRELFEELGIEAELKELKTALLSEERSAVHMYGVYICQAPAGWVFKSNDEVEELVLWPIDKVREMLAVDSKNFTGGIIKTFPVLLESLKLS